MRLDINRNLTSVVLSALLSVNVFSQVIPKDFVDPPREFSVLPFWFWNDALKDQELVRQIADFDAHGVFGFVIHPRIGLPENVKWLGSEMIHAMTVAVSEAARRGMHVVLYDEGMYPSGSSSGQVVERNPEAVTSFIELVYDRYALEFGKYFGNTILGIFTDEPSPLGCGSARGVVPGNAALLPQINSILGYDITPYLADLWYNDTPESLKHRSDYNRAINICLEENYYKRLGNWCGDHGIALMGHPAGSMDIGTEQYFQVPGQDLVWRYVEPGLNALEGQHSTMAKCASSAMIHLGLRRNSNELYGAYGHNLTYDEMVWLANWCFVRGQNLLIPHAFYYSIRGPRFDERPPDVGPNASWWRDYKPYADACRRLSWLNTDSRQICIIAIICKVIIIDSLSYIPSQVRPLLKKLAAKGRLLVSEKSDLAKNLKGVRVWKTPLDLINEINNLISPDVMLSPSLGNIRYRHVEKGGIHYFILFNEEATDVSASLRLQVKGEWIWADPFSASTFRSQESETAHFSPHEMKVLMVINSK